MPSSSRSGQKPSGGVPNRLAAEGSRTAQLRTGPPASASAGYGSPRMQSNVGARLLKKRQSVSYQAAIAGGISLPVGVVPGVPSLPSVIPPMPSGVHPGTGPLGPVASTGPGQKGASRATSPSPQPGAVSTAGFAGLSVDVEALSAESFKPEDCQSHCGVAQSPPKLTPAWLQFSSRALSAGGAGLRWRTSASSRSVSRPP